MNQKTFIHLKPRTLKEDILKFDGKGNRAIWPSSNDDGCFGEELYDHEHDTGVDFDAYENENIATVHPDVCKELFKVLRNEFSSAL